MDKDLLARHHAELDTRIGALLTKADSGDSHELCEEWSRFEHEVLRHFDLEEREVIPRFKRDHTEDAEVLLQEHATLRRDLLALGIGADLHCLRAEAVRAFLDDLRGHAAREDQLLYPWAQEDLQEDVWTTIAQGLRDARRFVARHLSHVGANAH
jgi:hemerythrin-like domain-containing protein